MQITYDTFVNLSEIKTKIAAQLVNDTEQVSGETKRFGVKRDQSSLY